MKKKAAKKKTTIHSRKTLHKTPKSWSVVNYSLVSISTAVVVSFFAFVITSILHPPCANSVSCIKDLRAAVENDAIGTFHGQTMTPPPINLALDNPDYRVLGVASASGEKRIFVDLEAQTLYAYQGNTEILKTLISSGKWGRTPTGEYRIWIKIRATRMSGGSGADYYNLPNVPYTMFYYNSKVPKSAGYSFHGAYCHNNFGHAMSHGCINMREIDAKVLYDWASPTTDGSTTYESKEDPGTIAHVCNRLQLNDGAPPSCID